MSRLLFVSLVTALSILPMAPRAQAPAPPPQVAGDETARINAWFETKFKEQLAFSRIQQTFLGQKSRELDDMSIAAQDKVLAWQHAAAAEMRKSFDYAKLTPEAQTSYDMDLPARAGRGCGALPHQCLRVRPDDGHPLVPPTTADRLSPGRRCGGHGGRTIAFARRAAHCAS